MNNHTSKQSNRPVIIILCILVVLLWVGGAAMGYMFYKETKDHDKTINALREQTEIVNENAQVIRDAKFEPGFRGVLQESANRNCSSGSAVIFNIITSPEKNADGSVKKYFGVGQYVCNNGSSTIAGPIGFVAAQSYDATTWQSTFSSSSNSLPGYIFNTDPALYNRKYNNPTSF